MCSLQTDGHGDGSRLEAASTHESLLTKQKQIADSPYSFATGRSADDSATSWTVHTMVMEAAQRAICRVRRIEQDVELQVGLWQRSNK